jgi:large subunit ribosomal protein L30
MKRLAVIRIKGKKGVDRRIEDTLRMLNLTRVNYCTIVNDDGVYLGMLEKAKDYITWGEVDEEGVTILLRHRGELSGGRKLTDSYIKKHTKYDSIAEFSQAFVNFEAELSDVPDLRTFFRLHPPRKGHEGIKRTFRQGGALGPRGNMKGLLYRMR